MAWLRKIRVLVAIALVVWIVFVVVAPYVDLPYSTLKASPLLAVGLFLVTVFCFAPQPEPVRLRLESRVPPDRRHAVIDRTCVRLC
jgi:hypothetical protein